MDIFSNTSGNNNNSPNIINPNQNIGVDFLGTPNQTSPQLNYGANTQSTPANVSQFSDNTSTNFTPASTQNQKPNKSPLDLLESELIDLDLNAEPSKNKNQKKDYE